MTAANDEATAVALEHFLWARERNMDNQAIFASIRLPSRSRMNDRATIDALKRTWLALQLGWTAPRQGRLQRWSPDNRQRSDDA